MFALSRPGKPRTSVHNPDALMVCWIVLNPLQSSAPLAVGLAPAAADPLNAIASAATRRTPTSVAVMRRRGASRLICSSPLGGRAVSVPSSDRPQVFRAPATPRFSAPILNDRSRTTPGDLL